MDIFLHHNPFNQVAMRCRPYSIDDKLGVQLLQNGEEEGEVNLLNSDYTTNRFAFTYAWWSAYGFDRHIQSNQVTKQEKASGTEQWGGGRRVPVPFTVEK